MTEALATSDLCYLAPGRCRSCCDFEHRVNGVFPDFCEITACATNDLPDGFQVDGAPHGRVDTEMGAPTSSTQLSHWGKVLAGWNTP
jgi:hypothetical protein